MSVILTGFILVIFPISIFVIYQDGDYTFISVWCHVGVAFESEASHQRDGPWGSL